MKNFKFKWLLLSIVLSIASINQVWATATVKGGTFYFDASTRSWNDVYMCVGKDSWTDVYTMTNITNTRLFYKDMSAWDGSTYIRFIACNWGRGAWGPSNYDCGYGYTNIYGADYTFNSNSLYLFTTASSSNGADVYVAYQSGGYSDLNGKVITVKAKVSEDNGRNYSEVTSPATLTASSHEYNNYNSCATSTSLSSGTISCGYAAETQLTAPDTDPTGYAFVGWYDSGGTRWTTDKTVTVYPTGNATFYAYYRKLYSIASGSTVVFDLGLNDMNSGNNSWSAVYLYRDRNGQSAENDQLTQIGTTNQYSKTYASTQSNLSCILFRENTSNWNGYTHTTNICRNISGVTLFTYSNSMSYDDNKYKADWQVTTDAKKATSGKKIYFDNTNVSTWTTIYLKYGTNWTSGGFNRVTSAATKVNGTSNLYCITIPNDLYYKEYYLSNATGNTGYHDIETMTGISARTAYQTSNIDADATLIATTGSGTGTAGNPQVWSVNKISGHTHRVTISAPSNGTITVGYTDESNTSQSITSSYVDVARTCTLTVSASAANGYDDPATLTINEGSLTNGGSYTIRENITVSATFNPHTYGITLNKGDHGAANQSATVDFDATGLKSVTHVSPNAGYLLEGYYDGSTKVLNADGSFAAADVDGYITDGKWSKYNADATLTAKFTPKQYTVNLNGNGGSGNTTSVTATFDSNVLSAAITNPKNTEYVFAGWYNDEDCEGTQVIDGKGTLCTGDGTYTDASRNWKKDQNNITLYAKWVAIATLDCWDDNTYKCGDIAGFNTPKDDATDWNTAANWGNSTLPDENTVVLLNHDMIVNAAHAKAKEVVLNSAKLTINPNMGLEVAGTITKADGSAPTASDLILGSSSAGNATLIFDNSNNAAATVQMYSKASVDGDTWNWQYMASPYVSASALHNYYGSYLYRWGNGDGSTTGWFAVPNGGSVEPWKAYSVTQESTSTFVMEGTLVPTDNIVELDIPATPSWIVANSWTAPIYIEAMDGAFGAGTEKTVYLFNTGFAPNGAGTATEETEESRYAAGTYLTVPVNSAVSMGNPFISSMQGFVVKNTTSPREKIKLTLNYSTMVRPTTGRGIAGGKMHAPKNIQEDEQPTVLKMLARGTNYDDCLYLLERADFTTGFDNGWDGSKLGDNAVAPRLYTTREDGTKESVSAVPEFEGSILTFRAGEDNVYTFHFEYSEEAETLYLLDLDKNIYTRVLTGSTYTFTTNDKAEHPRFILTRYGAPQITTGVDEVYNANSARKQMINGTLYIIRDGRIYNAEGALVK